jgi:hypothetical protein
MTTTSASTYRPVVDDQVGDRVSDFDWSSLAEDLDTNGAALMRGLLSADACREIVSLYDNDALFRSTVVMARHGFGRGEYRYFDYSLPDMVQDLRTALYPRLAPIANDWRERLGVTPTFPAEHDAYLKLCHEGDYNCLHQDLYGEHVFSLQVAVLLAEPGRDFEGGGFVLTEQRPRMQSRAEVVTLGWSITRKLMQIMEGDR